MVLHTLPKGSGPDLIRSELMEGCELSPEEKEELHALASLGEGYFGNFDAALEYARRNGGSDNDSGNISWANHCINISLRA